MEIFLVSVIILFFVFLNSLTYIAGSLATPPGMVFLGTVHWPGDYFYYLSQFAQGKENWFTSLNLYTNDFTQKTWVGWVNVFLGHLFSLVGINHLTSYQFAVVLFTIIFLSISYILIREIFPHGKKERIIVFFLFVSGNAFPTWNLSYYDFWFNIGIPFNRLGGVPHHLIVRSVMVLTLWLALRSSQGRSTGVSLVFLLLGFILGSIDPVYWGIMVVVFLLTQIFNFQFSLLFPFLFFFLGGLPIVLYLKNLFTLPPYSQLAVWERTQQMYPGILPFLLGTGPVMVLGIVGLFTLLLKTGDPSEGFPAPAQTRSMSSREMGNARGRTRIEIKGMPLLMIIFTLVTLFLYFSPVPSMLGVVNVRFLPPVTFLFLACLAAETISIFAKKFKKGASYITYLILFFILLLSLPAYWMQIATRITPDTKNGFFYITKDAYETYEYAKNISTANDTFLVMWPFNWSFPGITGRRVFVGHSLLSTDFDKKEKEMFLFFDGKMNDKEAKTYVEKNKIDFVITYPWTPQIHTYPFLIKEQGEGILGIYRVVREK